MRVLMAIASDRVREQDDGIAGWVRDQLVGPYRNWMAINVCPRRGHRYRPTYSPTMGHGIECRCCGAFIEDAWTPTHWRHDKRAATPEFAAAPRRTQPWWKQ